MNETGRTGDLLAVQPDGTASTVPNTYEGIKAGLKGATLTLMRISRTAAYYLDDEGLLNASVFNAPASMLAGRAVFGPVVLVHADVTDEGETLAPIVADMNLLSSFADAWRHVLANAAATGQDLTVRSNGENIPPPQIMEFSSQEDFLRFLGGEV